MNFINQAFNGKNNWWRYVILLSVFLTPFLPKFIDVTLLKPFLSCFEGDTTANFAIKQFRYVILIFVFFGMFKLVHKRNFKTLITVRKKFDFLRFWLSFSIWGVLLMVVFSIKVGLRPELYKLNFNLYPFLKLLLLTAFVSVFKVAFTVVLINSYILQMFTIIFKKPWVALFVSVLFFTSLMCFQNQSLESSSIIYYLALGSFLYLVVILDSGTEVVMGFLFVSALISKLFISYSTYKTQLNTVLIKEGGRDTFLLRVVTPFCFALFFFFLYKIYNWSDKKEKLIKIVE